MRVDNVVSLVRNASTERLIDVDLGGTSILFQKYIKAERDET
jgi:hypothetical protein